MTINLPPAVDGSVLPDVRKYCSGWEFSTLVSAFGLSLAFRGRSRDVVDWLEAHLPDLQRLGFPELSWGRLLRPVFAAEPPRPDPRRDRRARADAPFRGAHHGQADAGPYPLEYDQVRLDQDSLGPEIEKEIDAFLALHVDEYHTRYAYALIAYVRLEQYRRDGEGPAREQAMNALKKAIGMLGFPRAIATAWSHFISAPALAEIVQNEVPRAPASDYSYFMGTPQHRAERFYNPSFADPDVVAKDSQLSMLTPSGETLTAGNQGSKLVMGAITVPVLLVLAQNDFFFPGSDGEAELALFVGSADKTFYLVPKAGHSFMFHRNAAATTKAILKWLRDRPAVITKC